MNFILKCLMLCYVVPIVCVGFFWAITKGSFITGETIGTICMNKVSETTK